MGIHLNSCLKCLYLVATLSCLESRVFIASTPSDHPQDGGSGWDPVRMPELWIRTLYPETSTQFHPTMWMCKPADCDGFTLDLGGRIPLNTLELGNENKENEFY